MDPLTGPSIVPNHEERVARANLIDGVPAAEQPLISESWYESDGEPFVAVTQAADLPD